MHAGHTNCSRELNSKIFKDSEYNPDQCKDMRGGAADANNNGNNNQHNDNSPNNRSKAHSHS
jgi:hypothetical protein